MKFSEQWLREHVRTPATRDQLVATLTAIGLEVEEVTPIGDGLDHVVVAQIVGAERHPGAERLQVCQVDTGGGVHVQIVCGAPNARVGLKAPLAKVGAQLPGGIAIHAATLRGVESFGMLCSAKELGVDADASGLLELPDDAVVGQRIADALGLPDARIEIKLTPNRADCFSVRGIAFDVAAATGAQVTAFEVVPVPAVSSARMDIGIENAPGDVLRFCGRVIEGVDAGVATPSWMAQRLARSGVRPISLLVDVTQYVMLELGQPMHAYDRDTLHGPIGVRRASPGEPLALLDGRTVELDPGFVVVTDADRAVGLGGIMGGLDTRVTRTTRRVFLEAAHFAPTAIIGRGRRLGLHTDAAHRFERGVDPGLPRTAVEYATRLILDIAGGAPGPIVEALDEARIPRPIAIFLRRARLARVLGLQVPDPDVLRILQALGLDPQATTDGWAVTPPARRFDLAIEEDLIEEIARINGYDVIPTALPGGATQLVAPGEGRLEASVMRRHLASRDFLETINYAFVDAGALSAWSMDAGVVALANPLSAELAVMRTSLLPGLVAALSRNVARQQSRVRLFELGNVFHAVQDQAPRQTLRIAGVACGPVRDAQWSGAAASADPLHLKGDLESLASLSGARLGYRPSTAASAHPGRSADIVRIDASGETIIGWIGQLHPRLQRTLGLDVDVVGFEVDYEPLAVRAVPTSRAMSRYPSVRRDLALIAPQSTPWQALRDTVESAAGPLLREVVLFDRYVGQGVETGFKSLAIGLIVQDSSRTLADRDVDQLVAAVLAALEQVHGVRIRV